MRCLLDTHAFLWFVTKFDRLIIAQAMVEGISVVSNDAAFDAYPVTRLW